MSLGRQVPRGAMTICRELSQAGHGAWIVGGCVRDSLMGIVPKDWDIATSARPEEVQATFRRVIPTGMQHGTVTVLMGGEPFEVTTLRGESAYTDGRRPDSVFFVSGIEEDLARRDFTINAIAYDPFKDRIVDPFDGQRDLERKLIRAVGKATERFTEDGLRILRAARFSATLGFDLESDTAAAIRPALSTFKKVSHERVREEWLKAMRAERPSRAFDCMRIHGILDITYPELVRQYGCAQNKWHAYDVWHHTMAVLDASAPDPIERIAALLHDVGKPETREHSEKTGDYTFYNHERVGATMADQWLRTYRFGNAERRKIVHLVRHHLVCYDTSWSDAAVRRFIKRVGPDDIGPLLRLAHADALGKGRPVDQELASLDELRARVDKALEEGAAITARDLAVNGSDLMTEAKIPPGPKLGDTIRGLLDRVVDDPSLNTRETLLQLAREIYLESAAEPRERVSDTETDGGG